MAIALVNKAVKSGGSGAQTTDAIDTTGANLLVVVIGMYNGLTQANLSDSKSNTWQRGTVYKDTGSGVGRLNVQWVYNPTVGSGHTVTMNEANWPHIAFYAFSGADITAAVHEAEGGKWKGDTATSLAVPAVTPLTAGDLMLGGIVYTALGQPTPSGLTVNYQHDYDAGSHVGLSVGLTTPYSGLDPLAVTWSGINSAASAAAATVAFKAASDAVEETVADDLPELVSIICGRGW